MYAHTSVHLYAHVRSLVRSHVHSSVHSFALRSSPRPLTTRTPYVHRVSWSYKSIVYEAFKKAYIYIFMYITYVYIYIYRMWIYFIIDHISEIPETQSSMLLGAGWDLIILPFEGLVETMACLGRLFCSFLGRAELPGFWLLTAGECFKQLFCFFLMRTQLLLKHTYRLFEHGLILHDIAPLHITMLRPTLPSCRLSDSFGVDWNLLINLSSNSMF